MTQYVFGYGSLATIPGHRLTREPHPDGFVADLKGYTRGWGVAMDNTRDLPGYKHYRTAGGDRLGVFVAFLDVRADDGGTVNGVCLPVDATGLSGLDARERNYERIEVTDRVAGAPGRVWAYAGSAAGRERLATGRARGTAVIHEAYLQLVSDAFRRLGGDEYALCRPSLSAGDLPVLALERIDLPG